MTTPVLAYVSERAPATSFRELDCVRLIRPVTTDEGPIVAAGTTGTIVAVWGAGEAYEVEFVDGLATVDAEDLSDAAHSG